MPNYNNSHIYKLCCKDINITDIYIGSTTNFIRRKCQHKSNCNNINDIHYNIKVYQFIRDHGNWDNWTMILIENVNCNTKLELHKIERKFIEELKPSLNSVIASRPRKEVKKEYYQNNKDFYKEYNKEYYNDNKEKLKKDKKEYYQNNKEAIKEYRENNKEYSKEWRENNKEIISEKQKKKITCECGCIITKGALIRHNKSKKHIKFLNTPSAEH